MQELSKGQRIKVESLLQLKFDSFYDVSCFCLNKDEKLINDNHMVFYNQLSSPDGCVTLNKDNGQQSFSLNLNNISPDVHKLSFVVTADDKELRDLNKQISCQSSEFSFSISPSGLAQEKALMFCEVYLKEGQWRFNAYGQGFNAGLPAVVALYGAQAAEEPATPSPVTTSKPVSLTKISLTKDSKETKISLKKDVSDNSSIEVSTLWYDNGDGNSDNDDLDLRVGLLLPDGRMTMIHGGELGSLTQKPYILHEGDVRVVQGSVGMEKVKVNPNISHKLGGKVAIVFSVYSAVGNGVVSVASLKPKMEIKTKDHLISCEFNSSVSNNPTIYTYVIGLIVIDGDNLTVTQLGSTSEPNSEATPWITWDEKDGIPKVEVNGPQHFKGQKISTHGVTVSGGGIFSSKPKKELRFVEYSNI